MYLSIIIVLGRSKKMSFVAGTELYFKSRDILVFYVYLYNQQVNKNEYAKIS